MILSVLLKNEALKARKRTAFWMTLIACSALLTIQFGGSYYGATHGGTPFALPDAWGPILGGAGLPMFFAAVILLLMVTGEFQWRTARQNVIDGLSKEQWFLGKALLIPVLSLLYLGVHLLIGGGFAVAGTDFAGVTGPLIHAKHWSQLGGAALAIVGFTSLALFVGLAVRSPGSAMAVWLFYVAILERLLGSALVQWSDRFKPIVRALPVTVFTELLNNLEHDPAALQRAVDRAHALHRPPPEVWGAGPLSFIAIAWIAVLIGGAYMWFRRRDL